ncbi:hypothetical protein VPDG_00115 [Vibrio phage henriette 12B8]|uniref:hypothetical protein n=1 Tax=Vibrio phage henriette 12B8 TaxID=573174 RepID=UPI0002C06BA7|nr:hypothetical protein VPDG_00115 [Vibrio phage henriette 12B8]AGG58276.1 hypothetical protein VPDG_00115 [Vibrio phage henriette 12B8]
MSVTINPVHGQAVTEVVNTGGLSIIEVVERGPQGIPGDNILAAVSDWNPETKYKLNQKVAYLDAIYNASVDVVPAGTLPTDENFWSNITGKITEVEYTQTVASGDIWAVDGVGSSLSDFNDAKIQIWYNGIKLRKGTQANWVSSTEITIPFSATELIDYLVIRNG